MKTTGIYIKGMLIGMITEYCFRIDFGYLQGFILFCLVIEMVIKVIEDIK